MCWGGSNQDPAVQTRELEEYCRRRGWQVFDCYVDKGVSGKKDSRPQLNRMMQDAHERRFSVVVVQRFDRFARSVSHLLRALETFNALGIQFVSLSEQVDTSTPTGRMVFTVLGAVAEVERNLIVERVRAGLRHARAKGKRLGRPKKHVDAASTRASSSSATARMASRITFRWTRPSSNASATGHARRGQSSSSPTLRAAASDGCSMDSGRR